MIDALGAGQTYLPRRVGAHDRVKPSGETTVESFGRGIPAATSSPPPQRTGGTTTAPLLSSGMLSQMISDSSQNHAASSDRAVNALMALGAKDAASDQNLLDRPWRDAVFKVADGNSDGMVTKSELEQSVVNGNGTLQDADALFEKISTDQTGKVSKEQMSGQLAARVGPDSFGNALSDFLNVDLSASNAKQQLIDKLMSIGLTKDQAGSVSGHLGKVA